MEKNPTSAQQAAQAPAKPTLTEVMASLARNNINILEVTCVGSADGVEIYTIIFEYQWRTTPTSTKWTRCVLPWDGTDYNTTDEYVRNYIRVLKAVRELRADLEG